MNPELKADDVAPPIPDYELIRLRRLKPDLFVAGSLENGYHFYEFKPAADGSVTDGTFLGSLTAVMEYRNLHMTILPVLPTRWELEGPHVPLNQKTRKRKLYRKVFSDILKEVKAHIRVDTLAEKWRKEKNERLKKISEKERDWSGLLRDTDISMLVHAHLLGFTTQDKEVAKHIRERVALYEQTLGFKLYCEMLSASYNMSITLAERGE